MIQKVSDWNKIRTTANDTDVFVVFDNFAIIKMKKKPTNSILNIFFMFFFSFFYYCYRYMCLFTYINFNTEKNGSNYYFYFI